MHIKIFFSILCFFATSSLFCAEPSPATPVRPVLQARIALNPHRYEKVAYAGGNCHKRLTQMGIPSSIQNPLLSVMIIGIGRGGIQTGWTSVVPYPIREFECDQYRARGIEMTENIESEVSQKKLPTDIPA